MASALGLVRWDANYGTCMPLDGSMHSTPHKTSKIYQCSVNFGSPQLKAWEMFRGVDRTQLIDAEASDMDYDRREGPNAGL